MVSRTMQRSVMHRTQMRPTRMARHCQATPFLWPACRQVSYCGAAKKYAPIRVLQA